MRVTALVVFLVGPSLIAGSVPVSADSPVALVEEVRGSPPGVEFMDYLDTGKVIQLGPHDTIVLSYLKSCVHETITGGAVTIGTEQSEVNSGTVVRDPIACDTGKMLVAGQVAKQSAGVVFRSRPSPKPQFTIYGLPPIMQLQAPGRLVIDRIDQVGEHFALDVDREHLLHGTFYDFGQSGRTLVPGGTYRVAFGQQQVVFRIDPQSEPGGAPIVGRLVRFEAPN
ncbi:MAG: hypothetical protein JO141_30845 [Bradyrhizobium sp.]|nr:hypothetical protein [Bradyrhizobium sp.]